MPTVLLNSLLDTVQWMLLAFCWCQVDDLEVLQPKFTLLAEVIIILISCVDKNIVRGESFIMRVSVDIDVLDLAVKLMDVIFPGSCCLVLLRDCTLPNRLLCRGPSVMFSSYKKAENNVLLCHFLQVEEG